MSHPLVYDDIDVSQINQSLRRILKKVIAKKRQTNLLNLAHEVIVSELLASLISDVEHCIV
jgi:hypothetical protein